MTELAETLQYLFTIQRYLFTIQNYINSWWVVLDIALASLLIYELLVLVRDSRFGQMILSGVLIVGLFFLSNWLERNIVDWLIWNLTPYVFIVATVLFVRRRFPEVVRRTFARFGRAPFLRHSAYQQRTVETIEEIVVAVSSLATRRTGAIIVIERQIGLRNYIEGGIPLDATVTYDLLESIFQPSSPLHDGAVIVQGERIAAAACFLPLSINPRVSRDLGTRHRAALGLTEENDAVAIVVSEETGGIALVVNGDIERKLTPDVLRTRLLDVLGSSARLHTQSDHQGAN
jgi:diadenylate cyclase